MIWLWAARSIANLDFSHWKCWQREHGFQKKGGALRREEGEEKMPSCGDYIMHFLTLPWKLIFALIPPTGKMISYIFNDFMTII